MRASDGGEYYLPAVVAIAVQQGTPPESIETSGLAEALGINDRVQLSEAENILQERIRLHWMKSGVTMPAPSSVYIDADVSLGQDTTVLPNTHITGGTRVADRCVIGPNSIIDGARIGSECRVWSSVVEGSELEARVNVGPFTHIRPGSRIAEGVVLGNFAEVNRSEVGRNTKSAHFSYLGDAEIGENVNIGRRDRNGQLRRREQAAHPHRRRGLHRMRYHASSPRRGWGGRSDRGGSGRYKRRAA